MEYVTAQGVEVPALGFGTAHMDTHEEQVRAIAAAIGAGYRHIDTAQTYDSEAAVGEAIRESGIDRDEFFVTTKLSGDNRAHDDVVESTRDSLESLDTAYVDLLLIHSPRQDVSHEETLDAMAEIRAEGLVRHLGVSNFSVEETRDAIALSDAPIVTNQVRYNVRSRRDDLLAFCLDADVVLTAHSPVGFGNLIDDEALVAVGDRYGKTAAQVAIRWLLQQPMVSTIPMSSNPDHIEQNFDVFDFELSEDEMRELFALDGEPDDALAATIGL